ncbi:MAG TPA: hypothetical protein VK206_06195, partial [Anaerolineales bacterium]|nr:hypothetical protein [Anaerolineales bacterium]
GLPDLEPDLTFEQNYLAKTFHGNTSQLVIIDFSPPGCLRVLDPEIDPENRLLVPLLRDAAVLSNASMIQLNRAVKLPDSLFAPEPVQSWCFYFEKAELARQSEDWREVATLGDIAFKLKDHPNKPVERFVFIEGYAHVGNWERAVKLSREAYQISRNYVGPLLCRLWERIETETADSPERGKALIEVKNMLACKP